MLTLYKEKSPVRGVLFDVDGVILDTECLYSRFWMEACHFYGFPMTREQSLQMRSLNETAGQEKLHALFGPAADYAVIRQKRIALMDAFVEKEGVAPKPGIYALLDALDTRGIPCAITSSSPRLRLESYLTPLNLYHRFAKVVSGYDVPRGKPEPDIYLRGAAELGLQPGECLALEDSPAGILSAYRAGCLPVLIPDQDHPGEDTLWMLCAMADNLADVIELLP
ncbi:MAG: HAD family phosphatase [Clostridiales bacterium]|nr:HAD family phosphatase [Clostridiales bacterium]